MSADLVDLRLKSKARYASTRAPVRYRTGIAPVEDEYDSEDSAIGMEEEKADVQGQEQQFFNWEADDQAKGLQDIAKQEKEVDARQNRILQERERRTEEDLAAISSSENRDPNFEKRQRAMAVIRARRKADGEGVPVLGYVEEEPELTSEEIQKRRETRTRHEVAEVTEEWDRVSEEDIDESDESESEEEDEMGMAKPKFVSKTARVTVREKEEQEAQEEESKRAEEVRLEARKEETKKIVTHSVMQDIEAAKAKTHAESDDELPDDDDDEDEAEEYEKWRIREAKRIKQYRDERYKIQKEKDEVERRRAMTDEERKIEDQEDEERMRKANGDPVKWKFLQTYRHKGSCFQETESKGILKEKLYQRDIGHATGLDKLDKEILPEVMQVKNFGLKGRTKWTHLVNEDTTQKATESLRTTGTAADAVKGGAHAQRNQAYDATHFTYAFSDQKMLGSANYGSKRSRELV